MLKERWKQNKHSSRQLLHRGSPGQRCFSAGGNWFWEGLGTVMECVCTASRLSISHTAPTPCSLELCRRLWWDTARRANPKCSNWCSSPSSTPCSLPSDYQRHTKYMSCGEWLREVGLAWRKEDSRRYYCGLPIHKWGLHTCVVTRLD